MKRITGFLERENLEEKLKEVGFDYYNLPSSDGSNYWSDNIAYEFSLEEIDHIEDATNELHQMCLNFVDDEIKQGDYLHYNFSNLQKELIETSWKNKDIHLYGRFDFGFDGDFNNLKMFEYNADTPTSLLEASIVQWNWVQEISHIKNRDQFNSIHEELEKRFAYIKNKTKKQDIYLMGMQEAGREDWGNIDYLADVAFSQGFNIHQMAVEEIGFNKETKKFVDLNDSNIELAFKLFPLEWMTTSPFSIHIKESQSKFIEPIWKMLLSNKVLLPKLWEKHKGHNLLLPAYFNKADLIKNNEDSLFVKKPILGREGANISYFENKNNLEFKAIGSEHHHIYDTDGYIFQKKYNMPKFDNMYPVIGSWVVGDKACGIGIREDFAAITGNDSHFIPHYFVE